MQYLPLFFDLKNRRCLLIGGGVVALRKAKLLARAGAQVDVVSLECIVELEQLVTQQLKSELAGSVTLRAFQASDLDNRSLVICATNNQALNQEVAQLAHERNIPVNVVDQPELCSFIFPAIVDRSPIVVAVSSGGHSPVLARHVRNQIERLLPHSYSRLGDFVGNWRHKVKAKFADKPQAGELVRRFWENIIFGPIAELVMAGKSDEAQHRFARELEEQGSSDDLKGEVYLVGAGPGDPELLTFKAHRLMQQAEVVLYDRLVSQPIMDLLRKDAELIYVGKARADHAVPQKKNQSVIG